MSESEKSDEIGGCGDAPLHPDGLRKRLGCLAHPYDKKELLPEPKEGETLQDALTRFCIGCLNNNTTSRSESTLSS